MTYFKAEIYLMTECFEDNDPSKGVNPDTTQDQGLVTTVKAESIQALMAKLGGMYLVSDFDIFEGRLETSCEAFETNGTPYLECYSIYFSKVSESEIQITKSILKKAV